jgi:hypothetical protein
LGRASQRAFGAATPTFAVHDSGTVSWRLFCWSEFNDRPGSASATFVLNDAADVRNVSFQVDGSLASYPFCELRVDPRQRNRGNVERFLQARYP